MNGLPKIKGKVQLGMPKVVGSMNAIFKVPHVILTTRDSETFIAIPFQMWKDMGSPDFLDVILQSEE